MYSCSWTLNFDITNYFTISKRKEKFCTCQNYLLKCLEMSFDDQAGTENFVADSDITEYFFNFIYREKDEFLH